MTEENVIEKKPVKLQNNRKRRARKKKFFWIGLIVIVLIIVIAVALAGKKEKLIEVQTEKVKKNNITQVVTATGKIQSETTVNISAEVSGEIIELPFKEGDAVKKGDLVVRIKPDAYYPQLRQQSASVKVQENNLKLQEINLVKNELELNRIKELYNKGLASQSDLDNAQNNYDVNNAQINTIKSQIEQQRASLSSVSYDLSKTRIFSPVSGTVTQLNNEKGEKVLGTSFNIGSQILTISDLSKMEAQVEVSETDVTLISIGDTANITIDAFPDIIFKGYVYEIANSAKTKGVGTQEEVVNFVVKIRIINNEYDLRPGMSCTAEIEVEKKENVLSVPIQSVTTRDEDKSTEPQEGQDDKPENLTVGKEESFKKKTKIKEIVFIIEDGVAKKKEVKTGISDDIYIEIIEGLNLDDEVVKGSFKAINKDLEDNTKVKIDNERKKPLKKE
ncbi:MAG: efflux RND transporter periplasmic adaptor subunit [Ignavibacteria bacterium]|nr:efflux RND transporter periplasmic adaptor subunit [Ignavibacteria bacterium]